MYYIERPQQVDRFRLPHEEGGARFMICTDVAAEGINLQFCWIMINFDVPWNPARLEQRMGRIHRYGQKHDPVRIVKLVAPKTREGLREIKDQQRSLAERRTAAITTIRREPELIVPGNVTFIAHTLIVPSSNAADLERHDAEVERIAMQVAHAFEEAEGAVVQDVHTPELARAVGLTDNPGFDLLAIYPCGDPRGRRAIEAKGCANTGDVEVSANEWARAANLRDAYVGQFDGYAVVDPAAAWSYGDNPALWHRRFFERVGPFDVGGPFGHHEEATSARWGASGLPFVQGPNMLFLNSATPRIDAEECALLDAANCRALFCHTE